MFTGIDEVDWASMEHACGSAEDVPALLRGLASASADERERALDGMYGAVHHQGDVYDSTLACIPFLFALIARKDVADRGGVVELLVSIGGGEDAEPPGSLDPGPASDSASGSAFAPYAQARAAVRAHADVFAGLVEDPDPEVRRAVPPALVRFLDEPARVLDVLCERLEDEPDAAVRLALVEGLGLWARLHPDTAAGALDRLSALGTRADDPALRLAALGQLAGCAPERLPADLVPMAIGLLRARSRTPRQPDRPQGPGTGTLIGQLRRLGPADEEGSQLLRTLHTALGGRVAERIALLNGQLTSPDPADRCNAVWMSAGLFREWRASYAEPVALIGGQLDTDEERLRDAAVCVLEDLFTLAVPAAGPLAALVAARPGSRVRHWERGSPSLGRPLKALTRAGDARAVPVLAELLERPDAPRDLGYEVRHLGPAAAPLAPLLRARLADVPLASDDTCDRAVPLLTALTALRDSAAVPEVRRLLRGAPEGLRRRPALLEAGVRALGAFAAAEGAPVLRDLLTGECAVAAAAALWSVERDTEAVLPVLRAELAADGSPGRRAAADALGALGPQAAPALPGLRRLTESGDVWERTSGACAVWRVTGEAGPVLPVFRTAWRENACTRGTIAACLAEMGPSAAPAHDLLRTELANPRRHRARAGGYGSHDVLEDEQLLRTCRTALDDA
ncbi:HEAT repeat domain-containing protein [Streptomyces sp. NPDC059786]|uniref:HEAT repeat domain-containing protein n=1 Tax=Streptomyces sp. NPDC059786 TaxID=3346946 RepID=UPI00365F85EB